MPLDELSIIDRFFRPLAGEGAFGLRDDAASIAVPPDMRPRRHHRHGGVRRAFPSRRSAGDDRAEGAAREPLRPCREGREAARLHAEPRPAGGLRRGAGSRPSRTGSRTTSQRSASASSAAIRSIVPDGPVISITAFGLVAEGKDGASLRRPAGRRALRLRARIGAVGRGACAPEGGGRPLGRALGEEDRAALIARYRVPEPRVALSRALVECASAAMDVSDGLVGDCDKLCAASGCSASDRCGPRAASAGSAAGDAEACSRSS